MKGNNVPVPPKVLARLVVTKREASAGGAPVYDLHAPYEDPDLFLEMVGALLHGYQQWKAQQRAASQIEIAGPEQQRQLEQVVGAVGQRRTG